MAFVLVFLVVLVPVAMKIFYFIFIHVVRLSCTVEKSLFLSYHTVWFLPGITQEVLVVWYWWALRVSRAQSDFRFVRLHTLFHLSVASVISSTRFDQRLSLFVPFYSTFFFFFLSFACFMQSRFSTPLIVDSLLPVPYSLETNVCEYDAYLEHSGEMSSSSEETCVIACIETLRMAPGFVPGHTKVDGVRFCKAALLFTSAYLLFAASKAQVCSKVILS